jgi:hypothetical protein
MISERVCRFHDRLYGFFVPYDPELNANAEGAPFLTLVAWAIDDAAALWILETVGSPPDLVPPAVTPPRELCAEPPAYGLLAKRLGPHREEYATYRMTDGTFVARKIMASGFDYCFASLEPTDAELPVVVVRGLPNRIHLR